MRQSSDDDADRLGGCNKRSAGTPSCTRNWRPGAAPIPPYDLNEKITAFPRRHKIKRFTRGFPLYSFHDVKPNDAAAQRRGAAAVLALFFSGILLATAYSQSQYPYRSTPQTGRRASAPMQPIGGFVRNPYANSNARTVRSGVPIGGLNRHSYFQSTGPSRGNSLGYRPPPKPFAGARPPRGIITNEQIQRIEVSRGLWRY